MKLAAVNSTSPAFGGINAGRILSSAANINSWQQRAVLGVAAMTLQPAIDLMNKDVDKDTRKVSAVRTFSKALVGMTTGIIVRGGCMKAVELGLKNQNFADGLAKYTAENATPEAIDAAKTFIKNGGGKKYAAVMGTIVALGVMLFTNFLVDAPITNWLTNKINKKFEDSQTDTAQNTQGGIANGV